MCGQGERSLRLLLRLSSLLTSAFVWPARIHASVSFAPPPCTTNHQNSSWGQMCVIVIKVWRLSRQVHLPGAVAESGIPPLYWCTAHHVEMLLKAEVPLVHSAFRVSGFTPSQVGLAQDARGNPFPGAAALQV